MKKILQEFKTFISRGNVIDLAVGMIIGSAFTGVVNALTDDIIKPILNCIGGANIQGKLHLIGDNYIDYGAFTSAVINFLIMAAVIFFIIRLFNKISAAIRRVREAEEKENKPAVKICPYCKSEIPFDATRCAHCTSQLDE